MEIFSFSAIVLCMETETSLKRKIAIVDDEKNLCETVVYSLHKEKYFPLSFSDGLSAWESFKKGLPDLVILDITMPRMDGLELCRKIRSVSEKVPIIFLTSRDDEFDRVLGLEIGGDDYLCKPFSMRELMARIKVLFRRIDLSSSSQKEADLLVSGDLTLDKQRYTVKWKREHIPLTVTEFLLLQSLVSSPGIVFTRDQLMTQAYPENTYVSDRTIDSHIKRLRRKFETADNGFSGIETIYGLGYKYKEN